LNAARLLQFSKSVEPPFAAEGGLGAPVSAGEDPYQTLDELMVVVEVLCPVWPPREGFINGGRMLL
jgi:hypothetical protein